jgi:hypothetical protein
MPINPEIALGVKQFEMPDPLAAYAKIATIKDAQNRNALSQLEFAKAQREETTTNALNAAYRAGYTPDGLDYDRIKNSLAQNDLGSAIPAIEEAQAKLKKSKFDLAESEGKAVAQRIALSQDALSRIDPNGPEAPALLKQWHASNHADPILGDWLKSQKVDAGSAYAKIDAAAANGPAGIAQFQAQAMQSSDTIRKRMEEQNKPQTELGKLIAARDSLPLNDPRRAQYDEAIHKANYIPPPETPVDVKKIAQTVTDASGKTRFFNAYGQEIMPTAGAGTPTMVQGKPSATYEKTTAQRKQMGLDLDRAITELSAAAKNGGLIDQSTGSGMGQLANTAAAFVGKATPGAIAISKLQPIADMVLKMVPRFEGPQSDKDTQSYKEAAGQLANASLPNAIRKAAAQEIVRLMTARKGQFVSPAMADEGTPAQETTSAPTGNAPTQHVRDAADAIISGGK